MIIDLNLIASKISLDAPVCLGFTAIAFIFTLINLASSGNFNRSVCTIPYNVKGLLNIGYILRFLTGCVLHIFAHENFKHFIGNFSLILLIGPIIETQYGSFALILMILFTACITGIMKGFSKTGSVGASGIVFAMMILAGLAISKDGKIPLTAILVAVIQLFSELKGMISTKDDHVSHVSHIIGGICGALIGCYLHNIITL